MNAVAANLLPVIGPTSVTLAPEDYSPSRQYGLLAEFGNVKATQRVNRSVQP
jgi:hypothetical protein